MIKVSRAATWGQLSILQDLMLNACRVRKELLSRHAGLRTRLQAAHEVWRVLSGARRQRAAH